MSKTRVEPDVILANADYANERDLKALEDRNGGICCDSKIQKQ